MSFKPVFTSRSTPVRNACLCLALLAILLLHAETGWSQARPQAAAPAAIPAATEVPPARAQEMGTPAPAASAAGGSLEANSPRLVRIGGGDLLEIKVFGVPDLTQEVRVGARGDVTLALIGRVDVQGLTTDEAASKIERALVDGGFLRDPHVMLFVKEYATQGISVLGEVQHPGIFPLMGARRLFDAISAAGGTTARAGREVTITRRNQPDKPIMVELNRDPAKSTASNVDVFPGDTIVVSKAGVVYVVGDVAHPSGFVMDNNEQLSVLQAVALAGGANSTAALNDARIIRRTPQGIKETPIPLRKIFSAQSEDVALQPEDVVFVPSSRTKGAMRRSAEAVLSVVTGLAIYRR